MKKIIVLSLLFGCTVFSSDFSENSCRKLFKEFCLISKGRKNSDMQRISDTIEVVLKESCTEYFNPIDIYDVKHQVGPEGPDNGGHALWLYKKYVHTHW